MTQSASPKRRAGKRGGRPGKHGESKTSPRRLEARDRHLKALELRRAGKSYRAIAAELNYANQASVFEAVTNLLRETAREPADALRNLEVDRLDAMLDAINCQVEAGDLLAVDRALKIQARRAALLGLDLERDGGEDENAGSYVLGLPGEQTDSADDWSKLYGAGAASGG